MVAKSGHAERKNLILHVTHLSRLHFWPYLTRASPTVLEECLGDYPTGHRFHLWVGGLIRAAIGDNHVFIAIDIE